MSDNDNDNQIQSPVAAAEAISKYDNMANPQSSSSRKRPPTTMEDYSNKRMKQEDNDDDDDAEEEESEVEEGGDVVVVVAAIDKKALRKLLVDLSDAHSDVILKALKTLSDLCDGQNKRDIALWFCHQNGVGLIKYVIKMNWKNLEIVKSGLSVLSKMSEEGIVLLYRKIHEHSLIRDIVLPCLDREGGVHTLVIKNRALIVLLWCCKLRENSETLLNNGGVERVFKFIREYPELLDLNYIALNMVKNVCDQVEDAKERIGLNGGRKLLTAAYQSIAKQYHRYDFSILMDLSILLISFDDD